MTEELLREKRLAHFASITPPAWANRVSGHCRECVPSQMAGGAVRSIRKTRSFQAGALKKGVIASRAPKANPSIRSKPRNLRSRSTIRVLNRWVEGEGGRRCGTERRKQN
ncbi:hypothetical protein MRX96_008350 [Rhipicephalus microplus]